ncbi:MAG TPA: copper amine oxidase N-terminal domain-containing protein, partial [Candidatus Tumulicola sp.]
RTGRVFVPLRGIFERLGASVVYQNREINSTKGSTNVSLSIGSRQAMVNGQPQILDVAPFIVGATTYVPLRFIAQSLGAVVDYNGAARLVAISVPGTRPPPQPPLPPNAPPERGVYLRDRQPASGVSIGNRFTRIGARFSHPVDAESVRVEIDGRDITSHSDVTPSGFSYAPPAALEFGTHTVRVDGVDREGMRFTHSWSFATSRPAPPPVNPIGLRDQKPSPNAIVDDRFAQISARFIPVLNSVLVRVFLDNSDITSRSGVWGGGFSYKPLAPLEFGTHTVRVTNRVGGVSFDRSWSFTTTRTAENPVQLREQRPSPGSNIENSSPEIAATFTPRAQAASVHVRLDGNEITSRAGVWTGGFSYKPPAPLEFGTHTVRVNGRGEGGSTFDRSWSFTTVRTPENPVQLRDQRPQPEATTENRFVEISARFAPQVDGASVRVALDGNDITSRSGVSPDRFSYKPPAPLEFGSHTVRVTGRGRSGSQFDRSWSFTVRRAAPNPITLTIRLPDENET